eukprot:TRINITY_DN185_c1_g1_i1.p1 TRINITY_DN185_c1_g1~~TRINITY_DN185_c1_g1_i1.p1  ORF type:complete len:596 (+),score=129.52 TRINITY_DN185_c1_g1_i1:39-1826(+)
MEEQSQSLFNNNNNTKNNNNNINNNYNNIERFSVYNIDPSFLKKYNIVSVKEGKKNIVVGGGAVEKSDSNKEATNEVEGGKAGEEKFTSWTAPGVIFNSVEQRNLHYKTDWHRWNLKRRQIGEDPINDEQFQLLKQSGEITSQSLDVLPSQGYDSDSSSDEPEKPLQGSNRIKFITSDSKQIDVWKNVIVSNPRDRTTELSVFVDSLFELLQKKNWVIFMSSGGRFAGGIFDSATCVKHKTFVRYTVRKKQGGSQSTKDNKSGSSAPKSAGATLRRYNEKRFREQISEVLTDWSELISKADFIFLYAPGQNWNIFFSGENGLKRGDNRIRSVPFTVKKPTLAEVKKIHEILTKIEISHYDPQSDTTEQEQKEQKQESMEILENNSVNNNNKSEHIKISLETHQEVEDKISTAIINNDIDAMISLFDSDYEMPVYTDIKKITTPVYLAVQYNRFNILEYLLELDTGDLDTPIPAWYHRTALHRAAFDNRQEIVKLLLDYGAFPSPKDIHGKTPYVIASPIMREFMRKYAHQNLDSHPWIKLGITPLVPELEEEKKQKQAEKKKKTKNKLQKKINKRRKDNNRKKLKKSNLHKNKQN